MMTLRDSREACRRATRRHARSFYFASHTLPRDKRSAAYAVYAFCRHVDDAVDVATQPDHRAETMMELRQLLESAYAYVNSGAAVRPQWTQLAWFPFFRETVQRFQIPRVYFLDLLTGVEMDQQAAIRIQNWLELRQYCYHVASVVGLIMVHVLDEPREEHMAPAADLGIAMQLTNILRDIREDWDRGRVYLPASEMARFGVSEEDIAQSRLTESWRGLMRFQIGRAREHYQRAETGIRQLPSDGSQLTVWLMRHIYAGILEEIERVDYDVFQGRVVVSTLRKCWLAFGAWKRSGSAS
jgi:phytoene synthase